MTTSGDTLLDVPVPAQTLIHVHPGAEELGRVYQPAVAIAATPRAFIDALATLPSLAGWPAVVEAARADRDAWRAPRPVPGAVDLWRIVEWLDQRLPDDAILANGAGNFAAWLNRVFRYRRYGTQLGPYAGSMGYGVPAAISAKLLRRERVVVAWTGDGDFLMNGQELATALQYDAPIVVVVIDNGMYGTIRMHQEREYPARVWGTELVNPDFAALARAFGAHGETVERTEAFAPAFERALGSGRPALLHVRLDPQAVTMNASIDDIRARAIKSQARGR
jgi:acetolactate synthase-1/2/3 large subunit